MTDQIEEDSPVDIADDRAMPPAIEKLVDLVRLETKRVWGIEADLTAETLPLVDALIRHQLANAPLPARGALLEAIGCYFGEVVRRQLYGRWAIAGDSPREWQIQMIRCLLTFSPVGMANEVLLGCESAESDGTFQTSPGLWEDLAEALKQAAPMTNDDYYSLCGRLDVLHFVCDWLQGRAAADGHPARIYTADDYQQLEATA